MSSSKGHFILTSCSTFRKRHSTAEYDKKYGKQPYRIGLLHGGPGASGEMIQVAENLSNDFGVLGLLQTKKSINGQIEELMTIADSYDYLPCMNDNIDLDTEIHGAAWSEASRLRDTNELINCADRIECPVIAFHGDYDSHPIEGVAKPLTERLPNVKLIQLEKCGHTPWKEKYAKDQFFKLLKEELFLTMDK